MRASLGMIELASPAFVLLPGFVHNAGIVRIEDAACCCCLHGGLCQERAAARTAFRVTLLPPFSSTIFVPDCMQLEGKLRKAQEVPKLSHVDYFFPAFVSELVTSLGHARTRRSVCFTYKR